MTENRGGKQVETLQILKPTEKRNKLKRFSKLLAK